MIFGVTLRNKFRGFIESESKCDARIKLKQIDSKLRLYGEPFNLYSYKNCD